jgi:hypothetical protein
VVWLKFNDVYCVPPLFYTLFSFNMEATLSFETSVNFCHTSDDGYIQAFVWCDLMVNNELTLFSHVTILNIIKHFCM